MGKNNKIGLVYGYAVCLVAVIVFLISMSTLVNAVFDLSDPMHAAVYSGRDEPSLASFDIYKMEVLGALSEGQEAPEDQTLQAMYDAARDDRIQTYNARSGFQLLVQRFSLTSMKSTVKINLIQKQKGLCD